MFQVMARYIDGGREFIAATYDNEGDARDHALRANCKAYTPLYFWIRAA